MEKALQDLLASLGQTEAALQPFFEAGGKDAIAEVREKHGPKEAAEVQLAMAYTVNALFFAYLKTQGIDPQSHPVKEELGRVKGYMKKLKEAVAETEAKTGSALRLNKDAASRFIMAGLGGGGGGGGGGGAMAAAPELQSAPGKRKGEEAAAAPADAEGEGAKKKRRSSSKKKKKKRAKA